MLILCCCRSLLQLTSRCLFWFKSFRDLVHLSGNLTVLFDTIKGYLLCILQKLFNIVSRLGRFGLWGRLISVILPLGLIVYVIDWQIELFGFFHLISLLYFLT